MEYIDFDNWQKDQALGATWRDHHDKPVGDEFKGQFMEFAKALSIKTVVDRDLKGTIVSSQLVMDQMYRSDDANQRWLLVITKIDGSIVTVATGLIFAEMSQPYGWADADKRTHYIGVGAPGRLTWDDPVNDPKRYDDMPLAFVPQARPIAQPIIPGSTRTDFTALTGTANAGSDSGKGFTDAERAKLNAMHEGMKAAGLVK